MGPFAEAPHKKAADVHRDLVRKQLQTENFSNESINLILSASSDRAHTQKAGAIKKWKKFCEEWNVDFHSPDVNHLADFFTHLFNKNEYAVSTLSTIRSGMKTILSRDSQEKLSHPRITKLFSSMNRLKPSTPALADDVWDVGKVVKYLEQVYPKYRDIELLQLSEKCATLILISTMCRGQNLTMMDISDTKMRKFPDKFVFILDKATKGYRNATHKFMQKMSICKFPREPKICPYRCLEVYLDRTRRRSTTQLFVSTQHFTAASRDTISRWVKTVMARAGIDTQLFKPHSTRAASATKARFLGMPLDMIMEQAGWANPASFYRHYFRKIETIPQTQTLNILFGNEPYVPQKKAQGNIPRNPSMVDANYAFPPLQPPAPAPSRTVTRAQDCSLHLSDDIENANTDTCHDVIEPVIVEVRDSPAPEMIVGNTDLAEVTPQTQTHVGDLDLSDLNFLDEPVQEDLRTLVNDLADLINEESTPDPCDVNNAHHLTDQDNHMPRLRENPFMPTKPVLDNLVECDFEESFLRFYTPTRTNINVDMILNMTPRPQLIDPLRDHELMVKPKKTKPISTLKRDDKGRLLPNPNKKKKVITHPNKQGAYNPWRWDPKALATKPSKLDYEKTQIHHVYPSKPARPVLPMARPVTEEMLAATNKSVIGLTPPPSPCSTVAYGDPDEEHPVDSARQAVINQTRTPAQITAPLSDAERIAKKTVEINSTSKKWCPTKGVDIDKALNIISPQDIAKIKSAGVEVKVITKLPGYSRSLPIDPFEQQCSHVCFLSYNRPGLELVEMFVWPSMRGRPFHVYIRRKIPSKHYAKEGHCYMLIPFQSQMTNLIARVNDMYFKMCQVPILTLEKEKPQRLDYVEVDNKEYDRVENFQNNY